MREDAYTGERLPAETDAYQEAPAPAAETDTCQGPSAPAAESNTQIPPSPTADAGTGQDRREVVETYIQRDPREVVEVYVQGEPRKAVNIYIRETETEETESPRRPAANPVIIQRPAPLKQRRRRHRGLPIFLLCLLVMVGVVIAIQFLPPSYDEETPPWQPWEGMLPPEEEDLDAPVEIPVHEPEPGIQLTLTEGHGESLSAQEIYAKVNPSIVTVIVHLANSSSVGTGILFTEDGYLLTNYHVVAGGKSCTVTLDNNRTFTAEYVAGDSVNDIAILKAEGGLSFPAAEIGSSDMLRVGDRVYAIGNPLGVELRGTFTDGIVSAIDRDVDVDGRTMMLIQTNAALNSGNSGGPLINEYGQVIGINTVKMTSSFSNVEGLGFALPTASVQYLVNDLLTNGEVLPEPKLGISIDQISTQIEDTLWGLEVFGVESGSAAERSGVREGDFVIGADGEEVVSIQDLRRVLRRFRVGDTLSLTIWRHGERFELTLYLSEAKAVD